MNIEVFEDTKHQDGLDQEYRTARELAETLEYKEYRNFSKVIEKAKDACRNSGHPVDEHFQGFQDYKEVGKGALRKIWNIRLSRYACYLVMQNADPSKEIVAQGQTYFAIQTRKQEVHQLNQLHMEDQKRVVLREEIKTHNKELAKTARKAGVKNYAEFVDHGYMGLYGGLRNKELHTSKGLTEEDKVLDYMSSEELGANLFRATQTEAMIKRETIRGQFQANQAHFAVGQKVRNTIKELGGTMPENLPAVEHIKESQRRLKSMVYEEKQLALTESVGFPIFPLPEDAKLLSSIIATIKESPGELEIQLGQHIYQVNESGFQKLVNLLK